MHNFNSSSGLSPLRGHKGNLIILKVMTGLSALFFGLSAFAVTVTITDPQLRPVPNAKVLLGYADNDPFQNNFVFTNENGKAVIPDTWDLSLPVKLSATKYLSAIYPNSLPNVTTLALSPEDSRDILEIRGDAINFGDLKRDGKVDFALVYPAFHYNQFSRFDISSVLSPEIDVVKAGPKRINVPSNVALPRQKESYIIPIEFNKPTFRFRIKQPGDYKLVATRGQFPIKKVVDDLQKGKSFFDVMTHFKFLGGGERDLSVDKSLSNQDVSVDTIQFDNTLTTQAPNLPANATMLSFAIVEKEGFFFATDLKQLDSGESAQLSLPSQRDGQFVMGVMLSKSQASQFGKRSKTATELKNERVHQFRINQDAKKTNLSFDPMSSALFLLETFSSDDIQSDLPNLKGAGISIARQQEGHLQPQFLELVAKPEVNGDSVKTTKPQMVTGIDAISTRYVLSEIEPSQAEGLVDYTYRVLEVVQLGWLESISISGLTAVMEPGKKYKMDVIYTGRLTSHKKQAEYELDDVTHITRSSVLL